MEAKKEKKEKWKNTVKKKKRKKYSEGVCVVCIFFVMDVFLFRIKFQRLKKNLIFWFAHG
jgi:hypothetical protein